MLVSISAVGSFYAVGRGEGSLGIIATRRLSCNVASPSPVEPVTVLNRRDAPFVKGNASLATVKEGLFMDSTIVFPADRESEGWMPEEWMLRLKAGFEAGYYKTEEDGARQTRFPWQDRTCGDCPFWEHNSCRVRQARRGAFDATCRYFDEWNYPEAESIIQYNKYTDGTPCAYEDDQAA